MYLMGYISLMRPSGFSHRSLHGDKEGRRRLFAMTALVVLIILIDTFTGGSVRAMVRNAAASVWLQSEHARTAIGENGYFSSRRALANENAMLREQNAQYREKAVAHDVLAEENSQLRASLSLAQNKTGMTAPVVSSFKSSPYGTFLIGAGSGDPIAVGDFVVTQGGFVVGVVSEVLQKTSSVRGVFSAGEVTDALLGQTAVVVTGDGGGNAHTGVPRGVEVAEGDPVVAPAYGGRAIGIVGRVESSPTSPDQQVYIRLPVNLTTLRYVFVLHE